MSKKTMNGLDVFRKMENVDGRYLSEADAFISLTEDESVPVGAKRSLRERFAFTRSGWFAAAVSTVVALGAVVLIIRAGGSGPSTVTRPDNTFTPAASAGVSEADTTLTLELPEEEPLDEVQTLAEYNYINPIGHENIKEEQDKANALSAYLDTLGINYDYITYNEHDQVCVMLPRNTEPETMYGRFMQELRAFRIYDTVLYDEGHDVMAGMFWVFTQNADGSLYLNKLGYDDNFVLTPLGEPGDWSADEIGGIAADVFADKQAEGWRIRFTQMEDRQWLNICVEVDETASVDGDGLSLLMNEVWRRMDKKLGMISVSFCRSDAGTDDVLADFYIDYKTCHYGAESASGNISVWETPTIPICE